jgi:hypothetical protein
LADRLGYMPDDPCKLRCVRTEDCAHGAAERRADGKPKQNAHVERQLAARCGAIVRLLIEVGDYFPFKWFHV